MSSLLSALVEADEWARVTRGLETTYKGSRVRGRVDGKVGSARDTPNLCESNLVAAHEV